VYAQRDTIDVRELFAVLKKYKKLIWTVTILFTMLALIYVFIATPWWETKATVEIGKYIDKQTGKEIYLEKGTSVAARLKVKYIDIYKYIKNRDSKIKTISTANKNPQFITISALGKSNTLALNEIEKVISELQERHQKIIDEIIAKKQSQLDTIDRQMLQIEKYKIADINEKINYIKKNKLPIIDQKIASVQEDMKNALQQKEEAIKNLSSISGKNASLAALRLTQMQGLEYKVSEDKMNLINLKSEKEEIMSATLPSLKRELEKLKQIDLTSLREKRKLVKLSMQAHNYHNTTIVGNIIQQDKPVKPKKILIVIVTFITALLFSIFLVFFLEFLRNMKEDV